MIARQIFCAFFIFCAGMVCHDSFAMESAWLQSPCSDNDLCKFDFFMPGDMSEFLKNFILKLECDQQSDAKKFTMQWHLKDDYYHFHALLQGQYVSYLNDEPADLTLFDLVYSKFSKFTCSEKKNSIKNPAHLNRLLDAVMDRVGFNHSPGEDSIAAYRRMLASSYKIHLVPKFEEFSNVVQRILHELVINKELRSLVKGFRLHKGVVDFFEENIFEESCFGSLSDTRIKSLDRDYVASLARIYGDDKQSDYDIMPPIIINPIRGKKNAQRVLDILVDIFSSLTINAEGFECEGLGVLPLFDQRVTSLISYTQGEIKEKLDTFLMGCFQNVHFTCYAPRFTEEAIDCRLTLKQC